VKNLTLKRLVVLGSALFVLAGCNEKTINLRYVGSDKPVVSSQNIMTTVGPIPVFTKPIAPGVELSIGGFQVKEGPFLGVILRIDNMSDVNVDINPADILVKTTTNYKLHSIDPTVYINAVLENAKQAVRDAKRPPVRPYYPSDSFPGSNPPGPGRYINPDNRHSNNGQPVVVLREVQSPWRYPMERRMAVEQAKDDLSEAMTYAMELDMHSFRQPARIEARTWSYFYLFYELPQSYPVIVVYNGVMYPLSLPE
jgi:hypothetical protein